MRYGKEFGTCLLIAALFCVVAGCGDDSGDSNGDSSTNGSGSSNNTSTDSDSNDSDDTGDTDTGDTDTGDTDTGDTDTGDTDTGDTDTGDTDTGDTDANDSDDNDNGDTDQAGADGDWGNLIVTFKYEGTYEPVPIVPDGQDAAFCAEESLFREDLVVNADNQGIANVVGFLSVARDGTPPAAHPSNAAVKAEPVVLDNIKCRFEPHMVLLQTGQTLIVRNSDDVGHNAKANLVKNIDQAFNDTIPTGAENEYTFENAESLPMIVECTAHDWMKARLFILDHPFVGKSDENGRLVIPNLPVGTHTIRFNHEMAGNLRSVTIGGIESTRRGEIDIEIKPGDNDLGVVVLQASQFE